MRLDCPNCAAAYELPAGMLGPGGAHVQCTACHTRWFAAAPARPAEILSEDQIIDRLERWSGRKRPVVVAGTEAGPEPDAGFDWLEPAGEEPAEAAGADDALAEPDGGPREAVPEPEGVAEAAPDVVVADAPPEVAPGAAPRREAEAESRPAPRPARPRLEVGPDLPREEDARQEPARGRFGMGLAAAAVLAAVAFGLYAGREAIAARLPATAPALAAYAETVDGARSRLEALLPAGD